LNDGLKDGVIEIGVTSDIDEKVKLDNLFSHESEIKDKIKVLLLQRLKITS